VLRGLRHDAAATRGAKETQVYQTASPAVVLVVARKGFGSGALISKEGLIVTNLHVVEDAEEVGVVFKPAIEGAKLEKADVRIAKVVRRDEIADLALLQVAEVPAGVSPLVIGGAGAVQIGSDVHAIGHPTGEAWTYTRGIVSQIRRDYTWKAEDHIPHKATVIQTQTPINPGNSGGPLLDDAFEIIGINSFTGEGEGLNFAVSAEDVKAFLASSTDRLLDPGARAKVEADVAAARAACKATVLSEGRTGADDEDPADLSSIDTDCDGEVDYILVTPDNRRSPQVLMIDSDDDGEIDLMIFDEKHDGKPEYALIDTDKNGKPDMKGFYRRGAHEPYRYEPMSED
jgi:S1-C subfamily serine protease